MLVSMDLEPHESLLKKAPNEPFQRGCFPPWQGAQKYPVGLIGGGFPPYEEAVFPH